MSKVYTYQELRELALKYGIRDNKVHIGVWLHIPEHTRSLSGSLLGYKTIP